MSRSGKDGRTPRLLVVGSVNVDMIVRGSRLPGPGETVTGGSFSMAAGGKGANQAVAASRLGAAVTLLAKVGRDPFGDQSLAAYRQQGINTDRIFRDDALPTGVAVILVNERGENSISVASDANDALSPADVRHAAGQFFQADMLLLQLEIPLETVICAARLARDAGVPVMLDPAPAPQVPLDASLLGLVDYLKPNEHEAQQLTGIRVSDAATGIDAASALVRRGVRTAIVTLGSRGACWASRAGSDDLQTGSISGIAVRAVDSTAAGDAFSAAMAYALAAGQQLDAAVRYANLAGALTTTRVGAQPSLPMRDDLDHFAATFKA